MMTILLVDAADSETSILASELRLDGFDVVVASSVAEAREALASRAIVLAIVDLMLRGEPGTNGLELARELRASHPRMRVLLTSAYHLSERQLERADCGVSGFIPKPYELAEVVAFVRSKAAAPPSSRSVWQVDSTPPVSTLRSRLGAGGETSGQPPCASRRSS